MDKNAFRTLGHSAAKDLVPIHTIAFSPRDDRGPLLNLGEISKLSNGTFRWARNADDLRDQIETLADELYKQYVLTFDYGAQSRTRPSAHLRRSHLEPAQDRSTSPIRVTSAGAVWLLIAAGVLGVLGIVR